MHEPLPPHERRGRTPYACKENCSSASKFSSTVAALRRSSAWPRATPSHCAHLMSNEMALVAALYSRRNLSTTMARAAEQYETALATGGAAQT